MGLGRVVASDAGGQDAEIVGHGTIPVDDLVGPGRELGVEDLSRGAVTESGRHLGPYDEIRHEHQVVRMGETDFHFGGEKLACVVLPTAFGVRASAIPNDDVEGSLESDHQLSLKGNVSGAVIPVGFTLMRNNSLQHALICAHGIRHVQTIQPGRAVPRREAREAALDVTLAPGATRPVGAGTRANEEEPDPYRLCFERDLDRIKHSHPWRRLAGKCQVFIAPEDGLTIQGLLQTAKRLVARHGIRGLLIDPWNEFEHSRGTHSETEYISSSLTQIRRFARAHGVHVWLVAHPQKLYRKDDGSYPVPTPYDISGSAHWRNKADNAITVWRDEQNTEAPVKIFVQKIRFREVGRIGLVELHWNVVNGRYEDTVARDIPTHWQEEAR